MRKLIKKIRDQVLFFAALYRFFRVPGDFDAIKVMMEVEPTPDDATNYVSSFRQTELGRRAMQNRLRFAPTLAELARMPEGSLGQAYLAHLRRENVDPCDLALSDRTCDFGYADNYMRQTHDLWHALFGYGASPLGELGILGVIVVQMPNRLIPVLVSLVFMNAVLMNPKTIVERVRIFSEGAQAGLNAKNLVGVDWMEYLHLPVDEVRNHFRISKARSNTSVEHSLLEETSGSGLRPSRISQLPAVAM